MTTDEKLKAIESRLGRIEAVLARESPTYGALLERERNRSQDTEPEPFDPAAAARQVIMDELTESLKRTGDAPASMKVGKDPGWNAPYARDADE